MTVGVLSLTQTVWMAKDCLPTVRCHELSSHSEGLSHHTEKKKKLPIKPPSYLLANYRVDMILQVECSTYRPYIL